ncbi:MAG: hypothetical protein ABJL99_07950 [Aliishimia sp.]
MPLTPAQQIFCNNYLAQTADLRIAGQSTLLTLLATIVIPPLASKDEEDAILAKMKSGRSLLDDSTTDKELLAAKVLIDEAVAMVGASTQRIAQSTQDAQLLVQQIQNLIDTVDPGAPEAVKQKFLDNTAKALAHLSGAPLPAVLAAMPNVIEKLQNAQLKIAEDVRIELAAQEARNIEAKELLETVDTLVTTLRSDADVTMISQINQLAKDVAVTLNEPVSKDALSAAPSLIKTLDETIKQLNTQLEEQEARNNDAKALIQTAQELKPTLRTDATETMKSDIDLLVKTVLDTLPDPVSKEALAAAPALIERLKDAIETLNTQLEQEQIKRNEDAKKLVQGAKLAADGIDPEALPTLKEEMAELFRNIEATVPEPVTIDALAAAASQHNTLLQKLTEITQEMDALRLIRDAALEKLKRLATTAPALIPHARAPETDTKTILDAATKLLDDSAIYNDLAQIKAQNLTAEALEPQITELEKRMSDITQAIEVKLQEIKVAVDDANKTLTTPKGRKFSPTQTVAFEGLIKVETDKTDADLSAASVVVPALKSIQTMMNTLSASLAAYEKRINAVVPPDLAQMTTKEKATLAASKKAATDALNEVTEL